MKYEVKYDMFILQTQLGKASITDESGLGYHNPGFVHSEPMLLQGSGTSAVNPALYQSTSKSKMNGYLSNDSNPVLTRYVHICIFHNLGTPTPCARDDITHKTPLANGIEAFQFILYFYLFIKVL